MSEPGLLLAGATLADGSSADVRIVGDVVAAVAPHLARSAGEPVEDLTGHLLLPAFVEPHAHLDKAFTAGRAPNPAGDLFGAIDAWLAVRDQLTTADFAARARRGALEYLTHGALAIRTHTDVGAAIGLTALQALLEVRAELAGVVDIEVAAMANNPLTGAAGRENLATVRDAVAAGATVVGGAPWLDPDPAAALDLLAQLAVDAGLPLDLHVDESTEPSVNTLPQLADLVSGGFPHRITASHVVSLGGRSAADQQDLAGRLAAAGIAVVSLPQTNLWLQGRAGGPLPGRGLTAVRALLAAGVTVAAGGDNIRDPFNPLGRADPLETAALLSATTHLPPLAALAAVSIAGWQVLDRPPPAVEAGAPAAFLAIAAGDPAEAVAAAPPDRIVIRGARVVSRVRAVREFVHNPDG